LQQLVDGIGAGLHLVRVRFDSLSGVPVCFDYMF